MIEEEGLQNRFERHLENHRALVAGVEALGLEMLVVRSTGYRRSIPSEFLKVSMT